MNQMKKTEIKFRISKSTASFAFYIYVTCRKADIKEKVLSISTLIIMNYDKEMCNRTHLKKSINLFIIYIVLKQAQKIKVFHWLLIKTLCSSVLHFIDYGCKFYSEKSVTDWFFSVKSSF